jgi:hypothetical protein
VHNHNSRYNRFKHKAFDTLGSKPSAKEQKDIDERKCEGDHREAIFVELANSIEEIAAHIDRGQVDGTETITYAKSRPWVPLFLPPKLRFSTHEETAKVLYCESRRKGSSIIAITKSGAFVSGFLFDGDNWVNGPVERVVNVNRVRPNDIHPDLWWKLARAAQQAKSVLAYAKSKGSRD